MPQALSLWLSLSPLLSALLRRYVEFRVSGQRRHFVEIYSKSVTLTFITPRSDQFYWRQFYWRQNGRICCTKSRYERHFKNCHGTRQRKSQTDVLSQLCEDGNPTQRIPFATIDGLSQLSFADWSRNRCSVSNGRIVQSRWAFGEGVFSRWRLRRWK